MSADTTPAATGSGAAQTVPLSRRVRRLLRERPEIYLVPTIFIAFTSFLEYGTASLDIPSYILPRPSAIVDSLMSFIGTPRFRTNLFVTLQEVTIGYAIAVLLAFGLGIAISQVRLVEKALLPYIVAFQTVPKIALAPLFLVWFGFGLASKIAIAALIAFFPILINVIEGLRSVDGEKIEMLRSLGASKAQIFRMLRFPNALPFIFAGLDLGIIFAIIGAIVGEFVGARAGLGYQLLQFNYDFNIAGLFATLIVLSALGLVGHAVVRFFQRRYVFWAQPEHIVAN